MMDPYSLKLTPEEKSNMVFVILIFINAAIFCFSPTMKFIVGLKFEINYVENVSLTVQ